MHFALRLFREQPPAIPSRTPPVDIARLLQQAKLRIQRQARTLTTTPLKWERRPDLGSFPWSPRNLASELWAMTTSTLLPHLSLSLLA